MFRQFLINSLDRDWLRVVWRESINKLMRIMRLCTVTYGTKGAPARASACMCLLAELSSKNYPLGARAIRDNRHVDDFYIGADTMPGLLQVGEQLIQTLNSAGMAVGKWTSNCQEVLTALDTDSTLAGETSLMTASVVSTLGILWRPQDDVFTYKITKPPAETEISKRQLLPELASLYDPLGFLAPFIIRAKLLIQSLWLLGIDWNTPLSHSVEREWLEFRSELNQLEEVTIPRWLHTTSETAWELHGFSDASERAYSACLYIVVRDQGMVYSSLLIAKSRVAPIRVLNVPRLELCGALMLAQMINFITSSSDSQPTRIYCWTDSEIVLAWFRGHPSRWKTFTANRVSEILSLAPKATWQHVPSRENPADCATRGISATQLRPLPLWWHGPAWLLSDSSTWPTHTTSEFTTDLEARKETSCLNTTVNDGDEWSAWLKRFSSFNKLIHVLAYIARWRSNAKTRADLRRKDWLTSQELALARVYLWRLVQSQCFKKDLLTLARKTEVDVSSPLRRLSPFLDIDHLLRVGGRLQYAPLSADERHPIILPASHNVTHMLIREVHMQTLHGGPLVVQSVLNRQYWIIRGRNVIRQVVRRCVKCVRFRGRTLDQKMGPLPTCRTRPSRPFSQAGVDYTGPFGIKASPGRGRKAFKGYVAIFVCLTTKAAHIEVVSDYSSPAFLAAFKRFVARRGLSKVLYSDHGTTFRGADNELRALFTRTSAMNQMIASTLAADGVDWVYIPPNAPHFGGLWEATVKTFKSHLKRVVGETLLTFEEFSTLASQIEACLNSRLISFLSSNEEDLVALTPGQFLIGAALISLPESFLETEIKNASSRWQLITQMRNHFWS